MTDDQTRTPTLEDVRQRFLDAEMSLAGIGATLERLTGAAAGIGQARQSIDQAGTSLSELATNLADTANELEANAAALRQGVDAIRLGDPAEVRRQLNELDAGFTAFQASVGERFVALENGVTAAGDRLAKLDAAVAASDARAAAASRRLQLEVRFGLLLISVLSTLAVLLPLIRT